MTAHLAGVFTPRLVPSRPAVTGSPSLRSLQPFKRRMLSNFSVVGPRETGKCRVHQDAPTLLLPPAPTPHIRKNPSAETSMYAVWHHDGLKAELQYPCFTIPIPKANRLASTSDR
ncbi:hypothetical protein VTH06DRAFT_4341 [Thermothelomyces fergusii]